MSRFDEIINRKMLADFLGIPLKQLTFILYVKGTDNLYHSFNIPKKNGGERLINAPYDGLKQIQRKLNEALRNFIEESNRENRIITNISHGFERGKSIISNARVHKNKKYVVNMDIKDFFPSIHFGRIVGFFQNNRYFKLPYEVAVIIAQIACYKGHLPQGSPCSPVIANLICNVMDIRILKLAKKYKLDYTRYADDLSFSTNNKSFISEYDCFLCEIEDTINKSGFILNKDKTRLIYKQSRQEITGLTVNEKVNINRDYYKKTRAMAENLYKTGEFYIDKKPGSINNLEGRFAFINQIDWYDNSKNNKGSRRNFENLNGHEKTYQKFIFYKSFIANEKPLIITEGKTDKVYIKAALRSLNVKYPELIEKDDKGNYHYKISFFNRTDRINYFFNTSRDGGDAITNIYKINIGKEYWNSLRYRDFFVRKCNIKPSNVIIFLFDNETQTNKKPLYKFLNQYKENENNGNENKDVLINNIKNKCWIKLKDNMFIVCTPLIDEKNETEIEDLLNIELDKYEHMTGRKYDGSGKKGKKEGFFNKNEFSQYIAKNYKKIDFNEFVPLLDSIKSVIEAYR